ncbi:hypothetical protein A4G20_09665 [Pasteurellaceae bacterium RH1A]|nr:hypothetical protein A4G20_09665 [Pasteurellaceae bacterium RH1A]
MENLSLGQQLKQAREALNLTIEEVAKQTQLKQAHIDSLENDIFILPNVAPAFVRGYVRNYVRFLRLPEELIGSVNYGEVKIPPVAKKPMINHHSRSHGKVLKTLTVLVLLAAFGMTGLWWWQEHQKDQQNREQLVAQTTSSSTQATADNSVAINLPTATETTPSESQTNAIAAVQTNPEVAPVAPVEAELAVQQAVENSSEPANSEVKTEQPQLPVANEAVNVLMQNQPTEIAVPLEGANETAAESAPAPAVIEDELRIEVTQATSWLTVRGAKGKRLAEKTYNAGEVLNFNGNEQYRLTIGAPANVKLYYKGKEIPLKVDGRVVRLRLPLAQ